MKYDNIYLHVSNVKVCVLLLLLHDHLDYEYVLMCVALDLMHDYFYLNIRVYNGCTDDVIVVYRMAYR